MASPKHKFPFKCTIGQMALRLGVSRKHLAEVLNGTATCSGRLAFDIQDATRGRIKAKDIIKRKGPGSDSQA